MNRRRFAAPVLLLLSLVWAINVFAQEPANGQKQEAAAGQQEQKAPESAQERKGGEHAAAEGGLGAQLAEASREAAGEGEENAQFKESASVQWIASHTGLSLKEAYWASIALNFLIVAVLIGIVWKARIPAMFRSRTAAIQKGMEEARKAGEEASRRLGEIEQRLAKLDAEIAAMCAAAEADAAAEEERIRAAAEEGKRKVVEMAEQEIAAAARQARRELKSYAADLAVTLAEKRIRVDAGTDQALVRSFVDQLAEPTPDGFQRPRKETR